jgi:hypothetical protein
MHLVGRARLRLEAATDWLPRWLAVLFPFSIAGSMFGQSVLAPPPGFQNAPATPQMGTPAWSAGQSAVNEQINAASGNAPANGSQGQLSETTVAPVGTPASSLMQWGALHLRAGVSYQFLYDTGVHVAPGQSADTFTHTVSPTVTFTLGPHVSLTYSPSFRFFSQRDFHNTIDQFVSLSAGANYGDWSFGLSQAYSQSDEPQVETSSQTEEQGFNTGLSASCQFNDKISFQSSGSVGLSLVVQSSTNLFTGGNTNTPAVLADSQSYSGSEWMDYQFDEKLNGGLGVTVGYSAQDGGFKSFDEQYQARVGWHPGRKLTFNVSGGFEDQQFLNAKAPDAVNPIFSASIGYHLFEQTTLSLTASRTVGTSLYQSEITESTSLGIGLQQRLFGQLQLSLGFGYGTSDYKTTTANLATSRSDENTTYNVALGVPFLKHGNASAFYEISENTSSQAGFGYSSSEVGATLSWQY